MIYTLTLNPSVDLIVALDNFIEGKVNVSESEYKLPGGKGINVSQVLKNLGYSSKALGFIGGFTGTFIEDELKAREVETDFIRVEGDTRINIKMKDKKSESEVNGNSPLISSESMNKLFKQLEELKDNDILVMSGSVPKTLSKSIYKEIIEGLTSDVKVIVDTKGEALKEVLKAKPFLIKPNKDELEEIFEATIDSREELIEYGKKLLDEGAENVIISMAGDGALLINEKGVYFGNSPKGKLVNSVGAGDSLVGGFTSAIAATKTVEEAFKKGIASGSASAFSKDLCTEDEVKELLSDINIVKLS